MRVITAYSTDYCPGGGATPERYLVLEDGRGVYLDPLRDDRVDEDAHAGLSTLRGRPQRDADLENVWSQGFPVIAREDRERLIDLGDLLESVDALGTVQILVGPDYDACVPEGYVRLVDTASKRFVTLPWPAMLEAVRASSSSGALAFANLRMFARERDGADLWFNHEPAARKIYNGRTIWFHPILGIVPELPKDGYNVETYVVRNTRA